MRSIDSGCSINQRRPGVLQSTELSATSRSSGGLIFLSINALIGPEQPTPGKAVYTVNLHIQANADFSRESRGALLSTMPEPFVGTQCPR